MTQYFYDWRDRLVARKSGVQQPRKRRHQPADLLHDLDNLDEVIAVSNTTATASPSQTTACRKRRPPACCGPNRHAYDDQGRLYQTQMYNVDPTTGDVSSTALTTNYYYDHRGNQIAETDPGGLVDQGPCTTAPAGWSTVYTTDGGGGTTWADAERGRRPRAGADPDDLRRRRQRHRDHRQPALRQRRQRHRAPGQPGDRRPQARSTTAASYYDAADRLTADGERRAPTAARAWTPPGHGAELAPTTVLVTSYDLQRGRLGARRRSTHAASITQDVLRRAGPDHRGRCTNYTGNAEPPLRRDDRLHL